MLGHFQGQYSNDQVHIPHVYMGPTLEWLTHLPPGQNGCHFADDIFRCIFVNDQGYQQLGKKKIPDFSLTTANPDDEFCILIKIFNEICAYVSN